MKLSQHIVGSTGRMLRNVPRSPRKLEKCLNSPGALQSPRRGFPGGERIRQRHGPGRQAAARDERVLNGSRNPFDTA